MNEATYQALGLMLKDLQKIREKIKPKRGKEIEKLKNIKKPDYTEEDLLVEYGYALITEAQYEKKLAALKEVEESPNKPTALSEYLRILNRDIWSLKEEIREYEEENKHND